MMDADYHESRQLELYGALIAFLVLNNVTIAARIYANWRLHYRSCRLPFLEDMFILLSGVGDPPPLLLQRIAANVP